MGDTFRFKYLLAVFILSFILRLYGLNNPLAETHGWRQADTAAVSRNFIKEGFNPFLPKFDQVSSNNEKGLPNPNRYFLGEFPLYNILSYPFYLLFGVNLAFLRIISIIFSSLTSIVLFFLVCKFSTRRVAYISATLYAFLPYDIYFGRLIQPDSMYIFFSVLALFLASKFVEKRRLFLSILFGFSFALAILSKPFAAFLLLPIAYLFISRWGIKFLLDKYFLLSLAISITPFLLWRWHIGFYPEGMVGYTWLFNDENVLFTIPYFRKVFQLHIFSLILGVTGLFLFILGVSSRLKTKKELFYYAWLISMILYLVIIARGNLAHDYYKMPLVPLICIFVARGLVQLVSFGRNQRERKFLGIVGSILALAMFITTGRQIIPFYNLSYDSKVSAGQAVDRLVPKNAIVIAPNGGNPDFLYNTNRYGYTEGDEKIAEYIQEGATHLVDVQFEHDTKYWMDQCHIVSKTESFVIVQLNKCK